METNINNSIPNAMDFQNLSNMIFQGSQMAHQGWNQMPNQGENQLQNIFPSDFMNLQGSSKEINSSKSPWTLNEEHIF